MRQYTSSGGRLFYDFNEVYDYMKGCSNTVFLKDCPNYRAALVRDEGIHTLKIFFVSPIDNKIYTSNTFGFGKRLTNNKIAEMEQTMDSFADFYAPDPRTFYIYTEKVSKNGKVLSETVNEWTSENGLEEFHHIFDSWHKVKDDATDKDFEKSSGYTIVEQKTEDRWIITLSYYDNNSGLMLFRGLVCKWDGSIEE